MRPFKLLLFFSCVMLVPAALASTQDAIDLDDDTLLGRVKNAIDALVVAGDKARDKRKALEENAVLLREAREAANAPLPAEPGEIRGLEALDEQSLVNHVALRDEYLKAYRKRKEQLDRIPSLSDTRRKMINQAMEPFRIAEQGAADLRPLLTELARRIKAGSVLRDKAIFDDKGMDYWPQAVAQQQVDCAAWLETYSAEKQLPESRPTSEPAESRWNLETQRGLQHSLDLVSVLLQAARHEATEREELEKTDQAALPTLIARVHDDWRREAAEYQRVLASAEVKRGELAGLETDRRELASPSKESIPEGEGHAELRAVRRNAAFSDKLVEYLDARLNLMLQAGDLAKELMQELLRLVP